MALVHWNKARSSQHVCCAALSGSLDACYMVITYGLGLEEADPQDINAKKNEQLTVAKRTALLRGIIKQVPKQDSRQQNNSSQVSECSKNNSMAEVKLQLDRRKESVTISK